MEQPRVVLPNKVKGRVQGDNIPNKVKGRVQGDSTYGATLLDATTWHLGKLIPFQSSSFQTKISNLTKNTLNNLNNLNLIK